MKESILQLGSCLGSLREACGRAMTEFAIDFPNLIVLDADVAAGTGFYHFRRNFPKRFIQCGIAEQNMIAMAAGMATFGFIPVVSTYGVFSTMRGLEMVRNAIALPKLNVKITGSHLGVDAGPDGATHQCIEDIGIMRTIPNMVVLSPADQNEMKAAVRAMLEYDGPVYLRTGRSPVPDVYNSARDFTIGKSDVLAEGNDVCLVGVGVMVSRCLMARELLSKQGISAAVVNLSSIKPIDEQLLNHITTRIGAFVTAEDHNIYGGLGACVAETLAKINPAPIEMVGLNDKFAESGEPYELSVKYRLMPNDIVAAAKKVIERKVKK